MTRTWEASRSLIGFVSLCVVFLPFFSPPRLWVGRCWLRSICIDLGSRGQTFLVSPLLGVVCGGYCL